MKPISRNRSLPSLRKYPCLRHWRGRLSLPGAAMLLSLLVSGHAQAQTLAYYRFEEGSPGAQTVTQPAPIPDSSGNGNILLAFDGLAAPTYRADNPGTVTNPTTSNTRSLDFSVPTDPDRTRDLYSDGDAINTHVFNQFTIEASVKFNSFGGFQTFLGKDGQNISGSGDPNASNLYFQSPNQNIFSIRARQADGNFIIIDGTTLLQVGQWYNVAAVSDGNTLFLYVQGTPGGAYTLDNSAPFIGGLHTDNTVFTVGRGEYNGIFTDQFGGLIDEIRLSDAALSPSQFLFAPAAVPEPGSIALLLSVGTVGAGFLRRNRRSAAM